jgi:hypothetical protein
MKYKNRMVVGLQEATAPGVRAGNSETIYFLVAGLLAFSLTPYDEIIILYTSYG